MALDVIGESIRRVPARAFIHYYETVLKTQLRRRPAKRAAAKPATAKVKQAAKVAPAKRKKWRTPTAPGRGV